MSIKCTLQKAAVKLPSLETLASLTAAMATPQEPADKTAKRALAVWKSCAIELEAAEKEQAEFAAISEGIDREKLEVSALFGDCKTLPFEEYLKYLMPASKPEDRARRYRGYLRANVTFTRDQENGKTLTESELGNIVAAIISEDTARGVSRNNFMRRAEKTREVLEFEAREVLSARGRKGAAKRAQKKKALPDSKGKKTPQAKRKPRQAKG